MFFGKSIHHECSISTLIDWQSSLGGTHEGWVGYPHYNLPKCVRGSPSLSGISRMGVLVHSCAQSGREILEATSTLGQNHAHFDHFWDNLPALPVQLICFWTNFLLKHSKVSHNSSFLSIIARKGGGVPFSLSSALLSVRCSPKGGGSFASPLPPWIRHWV